MPDVLPASPVAQGPPPPLSAPPGASPTPASPTLKAEPAGLHMRGRLQLQILAAALNRALGMLQVGSEEHKDALAAMKLLAPYGRGSSDNQPLQKSELQALGQGSPAMPAIGPQQRAAFQQLIQKMNAMGPGAGAQAAAPAGGAPNAV